MTPRTMLLASAAPLILFGIPLWARRIPQNRIYGVRTRETLADKERWYDVNARCGRDLAVAGALFLFGMLVIDGIGAQWPADLRILASALLLVAMLVVVTVRALRLAKGV